jgi:hypothetical protein
MRVSASWLMRRPTCDRGMRATVSFVTHSIPLAADWATVMFVRGYPTNRTPQLALRAVRPVFERARQCGPRGAVLIAARWISTIAPVPAVLSAPDFDVQGSLRSRSAPCAVAVASGE